MISSDLTVQFVFIFLSWSMIPSSINEHRALIPPSSASDHPPTHEQQIAHKGDSLLFLHSLAFMVISFEGSGERAALGLSCSVN